MPHRPRKPKRNHKTSTTPVFSHIINRRLEIKKKKEEDEATAEVYKEFVESFDKNKLEGISRSWVRGGIVNKDSETTKIPDRVYKPKIIQKINQTTSETSDEENISEKFIPGRRKTSITSFREELIESQKKRQNLHKTFSAKRLDTTVIKIPTLENSVTDGELIQLFEQFGKLFSAKTSWNNSRTEKSATIIFLQREDAEKAFHFLNGRQIRGVETPMEWGRAVPIPSEPFPSEEIRVSIPQDIKELRLIHRMIEFVLNEGKPFETAILEKEKENPEFNFLFDESSPSHIYYKWKIFSLLHGDGLYHWREDPFCMIEGGPLWIPPTPPDRSELLTTVRNDLPSRELEKLNDLLGSLNTSRTSIGRAMCWCIEHSEYSRDICARIADSLGDSSTIPKLFLLNDILYNSGSTVSRASSYRSHFKGVLEKVVRILRKVYEENEGEKAEQFKSKVLRCFSAWEDWSIYSNDYLIQLHSLFIDLPSQGLGGVSVEDESDDIDGVPLDFGDIDGVPMEDEFSDIDGVPWDGGFVDDDVH